MVGDGTYMMMNSDIYSTVLSGHKMIVVVCDNGGFAVINRLQQAKGVPGFNNQLTTVASRIRRIRCMSISPSTPNRWARRRAIARASPICKRRSNGQDHGSHHGADDRSDAYAWVPGDADWDVGVPEVSSRESVREARKAQEEIRAKQRVGV